jgi:hypothetical protein
MWKERINYLKEKMNKIFLILLTLLLLMLILNHAEDKSMPERSQAYEDQRKILEEAFGEKAKYQDGKYEDPSTIPPLAPSGIKATDYERTDRPTTAPPPGTPSWCPPPQKIGSPPVDTDTVDNECINY